MNSRARAASWFTFVPRMFMQVVLVHNFQRFFNRRMHLGLPNGWYLFVHRLLDQRVTELVSSKSGRQKFDDADAQSFFETLQKFVFGDFRT